MKKSSTIIAAMRRWTPIVFGILVLCGCSAQDPPPNPALQPAAQTAELHRFVFEQPEMGTLFRVVIYAPDQAAANAGAAAAWSRVGELNHILSDYDPNSELSRLCSLTDKGPMRQPVHVSDDLWTVVSVAIGASRLSGGAFDITVGPLTRIQRLMRKTNEMPSPEQLQEARQSVGWKYVKLDPANHSIQLLHAKMRLDVGGIAKGYSSSQVLRTLRKMGLPRALCGAAGDIVAGDPPPGRRDWIVGIQSLSDPQKIAGHVRISNYAISTSGDTYRGADVDGKRFSHIVDPRTGLGLTRRIGVTSLAPDGITADWITKPISILGPEEGLKIIEQIPGAAARVVVIDDSGHEKVYESKGFAGFLVPEQPTTGSTPTHGSVPAK